MHQLSEASGRVPWPGGFSLSAAMHAVPKPLMEPPAALLLPYGPHCALSMQKKYMKKISLKLSSVIFNDMVVVLLQKRS